MICMLPRHNWDCGRYPLPMKYSDPAIDVVKAFVEPQTVSNLG